MAYQGANSFGPAVDPKDGLLSELASDARSAVAKAKARFDAVMATLEDADVSKGAALTRDKAKLEDARLNGARAGFTQASASLSAISVARFGAARRPGSSNPKQQDDGEGSSKQAIEEEATCAQGWVKRLQRCDYTWQIGLACINTFRASYGS